MKGDEGRQGAQGTRQWLPATRQFLSNQLRTPAANCLGKNSSGLMCFPGKPQVKQSQESNSVCRFCVMSASSSCSSSAGSNRSFHVACSLQGVQNIESRFRCSRAKSSFLHNKCQSSAVSWRWYLSPGVDSCHQLQLRSKKCQETEHQLLLQLLFDRLAEPMRPGAGCVRQAPSDRKRQAAEKKRHLPLPQLNNSRAERRSPAGSNIPNCFDCCRGCLEETL